VRSVGVGFQPFSGPAAMSMCGVKEAVSASAGESRSSRPSVTAALASAAGMSSLAS
jgi:hypothetical protein